MIRVGRRGVSSQNELQRECSARQVFSQLEINFTVQSEPVLESSRVAQSSSKVEILSNENLSFAMTKMIALSYLEVQQALTRQHDMEGQVPRTNLQI